MINPVRNRYLTAKKLNIWSGKVTTFSSAIVLVAFIISKINISFIAKLQEYVDYVGCSAIFIVAVLSCVCSHYHTDAENNRRKMAIDNAYDKRFCEEKSLEYYTNDSVKIGIERLTVNYFESCLYTNYIAKKMVKPLSIKSILLITPFFLAIFLRDNQFLVLLANLAIVPVIISEWVRTVALVKKTTSLLEQFRLLYDSKQHLDSNSKNSAMLLLILDYEASISWSHILLCEKIYERERGYIGKRWEEIKHSYNI